MSGVGVGIGAGQIAGKVSAPPGINAGMFGVLTILSALSRPAADHVQAMVRSYRWLRAHPKQMRSRRLRSSSMR
jgi:hypothetical protein